MSGGLLDGMRVVDAGIWRPVPHATQILADLGAEVTKLEPPGGDPMRAFPELFADIAGHKRSVMVDLRTDEGRAHAADLVAAAHVFTEGWRPGVAARFGLDAATLRARDPALIHCSVSGYGQSGSRRDLPGHDVSYQALAGVIAPRGPEDPPPSVPRVPLADLAAGTLAAALICAAWARRLQTGEGETIDVAMADVVAAWSGPRATTSVAGRSERMRGTPGYGVYPCRDGRHLALAVITEDHFWRAICDVLDLAPLRDLTHAARLDRAAECDGAVRDAVAGIDRDTAVAALAAAGAPVAPVLTPEEAAGEEQFRARGVFVPGEDGARVGLPAVLADHPVRAPGPAPAPGQHGRAPA